MEKLDYKKKQDEEVSVYERPDKIKRNFVGRLFHNPLFYSFDRVTFNHIFPRTMMGEVVGKHLSGGKVENLLIAPCGNGVDYPYLNNFSKNYFGIDLSTTAIKSCPSEMRAKVGDILKSGYPNELFDLIACPLFFHHMLKIGFDPILNEFYRLLRRGGKLVILEPSILYPLNIITRTIKKVFNNPYQEVEDESAFYPGLMTKALRNTGFVNIEVHGASYSHSCFYKPLSKVVNMISKPLLEVSPLKYFAWMNVYWAEKSN